MNELLGPAGGPDEEVAEPTVRERYLLGMLAPRKQALEPEEFDDLPQAGDDGEDGAAETGKLPARTLFPSSLGMSFCVSLEAQAFVVAARWGQYQRVQSENTAKLVWKRIPRGGLSQPISLAPGRIAPWVPDSECPQVFVAGLVRRREDHYSVCAFRLAAAPVADTATAASPRNVWQLRVRFGFIQGAPFREYTGPQVLLMFPTAARDANQSPKTQSSRLFQPARATRPELAGTGR